MIFLEIFLNVLGFHVKIQSQTRFLKMSFLLFEVRMLTRLQFRAKIPDFVAVPPADGQATVWKAAVNRQPAERLVEQKHARQHSQFN